MVNLVGSEVGSEIYALWQAYEYEMTKDLPLRLQEFFGSTAGKFQHDMVRSWLDELNERRNTAVTLRSPPVAGSDQSLGQEPARNKDDCV